MSWRCISETAQAAVLPVVTLSVTLSASNTTQASTRCACCVVGEELNIALTWQHVRVDTCVCTRRAVCAWPSAVSVRAQNSGCLTALAYTIAY